MSSGQHKATVILDGKSDGLNKAAKAGSNRIGVLESMVEKLQAELAKATQRLDAQSAALDKSKQQLKEQAEAARTAAQRQAELAKQAKQSRAEDAEWAKAIRKVKGEIAAAEKEHAAQQAKAESAWRNTAKATGEGTSAMVRARQAWADWSIIGRTVIDTISAVATKMFELAEESIAASNIYQNLPFSIDKARASTQGMVDDLTLAKFATTLNRTEVAKTADEYARFAGAAVKLGASVGLGAEESLNSLTAALARGSTEMLDNLGIVLKKDQAEKIYAEQLGKTRDALTEAEKAEAFRKVGMQRVIEAAESVEVKTDGAAAAVKRFGVELENLKNEALSGDTATRTLSQGMRSLALQTSIRTSDVRKNLRVEYELRDALADVNVSADALKVSNIELADALARARSSIRSKVKDAILENTITEETVANMRALLEVDSELNDVDRRIFAERIAQAEAKAQQTGVDKSAREQELQDLQMSIAYLEGKGDEEKLLNAAIREEMELRATILEMEGKSLEAAKLRRDAEILAQRQAGQAARTRRGGRGRGREFEFTLDAVFGDTERALARIEAQEQRALAALDRSGAGAQKRWAELSRQIQRGEQAMADLQELLDRLDERATPDPFSLESFAAVRAREQDFAAANDEIYLNRQRRAASGIEDPLARMEAETQARLAYIDARQQAANDTIEILRLEDERESALHELKMARLEEEKQRQAEMLAQRVAIAEETADLMMGVATVALRAAFLEEGSIRKKVAAVAKANAFEMLAVQAPAETLRGLIAAASYNVPKAALHFANAGKAAALGGSMLAIAGAAGGLGRTAAAPATGAGFGASAGPGGGFGGGSGGGGSPRSGGSSSQIPESEEPTFRRAAAPAAGAGGPVLNITIQGDVVGTPKKEFYRELDRGFRDLGYSTRRLS